MYNGQIIVFGSVVFVDFVFDWVFGCCVWFYWCYTVVIMEVVIMGFIVSVISVIVGCFLYDIICEWFD